MARRARPADLRDRRVEITGPTEAKVLINAWNSGARVHLADFEDANAPTWHNLVTGQANLVDANRAGNPGCLMHLTNQLRAAGAAVAGVHTVELLAAAVDPQRAAELLAHIGQPGT